jgi:hypothetical protein
VVDSADDIDDMQDRLAVNRRSAIGIVAPVRGDPIALDWKPARKRAVVVGSAAATRVDGHPARRIVGEGSLRATLRLGIEIGSRQELELGVVAEFATGGDELQAASRTAAFPTCM